MDIAGLVRVVKAQVKLGVAGLDVDGTIADYLDEIPVEISTRGRAGRAGRAGFCHLLGYNDIGRVVINVGVCYTEERFRDTLFHELAHAVCYWLHGEEADSHGPKWKAVMVQLGQKPERCHNYQDRR
jgi:hypothetical protein